MVNLGDTFPDVDVSTTHGRFRCHEYFEDGWAFVFSHPGDFTPVCTSELGQVAKMSEEFAKRRCKVLAVSCDSVAQHKEWTVDVCAEANIPGATLPFPIVADPNRLLSVRLGMLDAEFKDKHNVPLAARATFLVGADKRIKWAAYYPGIVGRDFNEVLRVLDALQLAEKFDVCAPCGWKKGNPVMPHPRVSAEDFTRVFPKGVTVKEMPSGKNYMYYTPHPSDD